MLLHGHLLDYTHTGFILKSQNLETNFMFINRRMNEDNVGHLYN